MAIVIPDALPDVRYWLRNHPDLQPYHSGRVFFRIPDADKLSGFPIMRLYRLAGGVIAQGGDVNISQVAIAVECWHNQNKGYDAIRQMAVALESACQTLPAGQLLNPTGETRAQSARVINVLDSPDADTGWPRLVCDTSWVFQGL